MGRNVAIVGPSGSGKSTSLGSIPQLGIKGLNPSETVIVNVANKPLPFKGWAKNYDRTKLISDGGNYIETYSYDKIANIIDFVSAKRPEIKAVVIDDAQYILAFEFMDRAKESGYGKYGDFGVHLHKVLNAGVKSRADLSLFYLWHPEDTNSYKMKTVGKMIDDYITVEGLFTTALMTKVSKADNKIKYEFVTNNDGFIPAKSPIGMFESLYIPNDLGLVLDKIREYDLA